jgi:hypothetical protein
MLWAENMLSANKMLNYNMLSADYIVLSDNMISDNML